MTHFCNIFSGLFGAGYRIRNLFVVFSLLTTPFHIQNLDCQTNGADSLMIFRFLKEDVVIPEPGAYFNVLEIKNNDNDSIAFVTLIGGPDGWHFIGSSSDTVVLGPGETRLLPVRVSIPKSTIGGVSFVIGAELFGKDLYNYANAYVSIERKSRWDMRLHTSQVYLSDFKPYGDMLVSLNNTGNSNELIKLAFDIGGLLEFRDALEADSFLYVDLPAYKDTTLSFQIQQNKDLSYAVEQSYKNRWWANSVNIEASTPERRLFGNVRATTLESSYINELPLLNSPLNTEITLYNLLSNRRKKASVRVFGKILFPGTQQLQYSLGYYNLYFDLQKNRSVDLYRQLRYMVRYTDTRSMVWLGDRLGVGQLHTLTGRGISAHHLLGEKHTAYLNVIQNLYSKNIGGFMGYRTTIGKVSVNTGITLETTTDQRYGHYSLHLGAMYRFLEKHSVQLETATSMNRFSDDRYLENDTTVAGLAYTLVYRYSDKRLLITAENMNTQFSYLRNSGINRINLNGRYLISGKMRLRARYHRMNYASSKYPYNFVYPLNNNINENARILFSYNQGYITYQAGPQYRGTVRNYYNPATEFGTMYQNYQPGLMGSVSFRIGTERSISPNFAFNTMYYSFDAGDPEADPPELSNRWQYNLGINYYDRAFKFNAYYTTGEASDIYRTAVIGNDPQVNQSFHVRPYYERYFLKDNLRLSGFLNYSYYMPSLRENMLMNITGDIYVGKAWKFFAGFNLYRVSRTDPDAGRITTRDINMLIGIKKAFDIQQPRLAYYDLTIVGFNDLDGNGMKDDNEKPISNVLITISRDQDRNLEHKTGFAEISMITDPLGEIYYGNMPEGYYDLTISPLNNLEDLYFLHGEKQAIELNADQVYYLPLVESYKVRGKIIIDRDPNSNEGVVSAEGIRITALSDNGDSYSTLSNSFGTYVLDLPRATSYEVNIYNVFGENFRLERGTYKVQFTENKTINLDFKFTERRRAIQFNPDEQFFQFNLDNGNQQQ